MIPLRDDNPTTRPAFITLALMAACSVVFLWQVSLGPPLQVRAAYALGFVPAHLFAPGSLPAEVAPLPAGVTLLTSMFLHGGVLHLAGNMLYLWIFGNNVEEALGRGRFVLFYLLCGGAAAMAQALPDPHSTLPMIGASGAISGVLGAYALLYPRARVLVAIPVIIYLHLTYLPAVAVIGIWFALQLVSSLLAPAGEGGVAWFAHLGGFIAGLALTPLLRRR